MSKIVKDWSRIKLGSNAVLLLGNGASRAIDNDAFDYESLLSRAELSESSKQVFELIGDSDFEKALLRLEITKETNKAVGLDESITQDYIDEIRNGLVTAVRSIHPPQGLALDLDKAVNAIHFMEGFKAVFTLNYDFFLYWLLQLSRDYSSKRCFKDWFKPRDFDYSWSNGIYEPHRRMPSTACFFLHGALHLVDEPESKIVLDVQDEQSNIKLTDKVEAIWNDGQRPLFVSEGKASLKEARIKESVYLRHAFEQFKQKICGKELVIYGASLSAQDQHLVDAIRKSKPSKVYVAIYEPKDSRGGWFEEWSQKLHEIPLEFFDSKSPGSWIY